MRRRGGRRGHIRLPSEDFDDDPDEWSGGDLEVEGYRDEEEAVGAYRDVHETIEGDELGSVRESSSSPEAPEEEESRGRTVTRAGQEPLL
jgi:hypothetical protein